jgi:hypothetical protein
MRRLSAFFVQISGSAIEKFAISAAIVAVAGLAGANFLAKMPLDPHDNYSASNEKALKSGDNLREKLAGLGSLIPTGKERTPKFSDVDTTPTASVSLANGQPVILDPCTGKTK